MIKVIENSNIVDWDKYPEFICALVMQTKSDLVVDGGYIMPKGEEITWLCDKAPKFKNGEFELSDAKVNCLGGVGFRGNHFCLDADLKEIHYKPKPKIDIKKYKEEYIL